MVTNPPESAILRPSLGSRTRPGGRVSAAERTIKYAPSVMYTRERYSPGVVIDAVSKPITGNPDPDHLTTSFVERQNLTMRMMMRRLTRLTNAFSKKRDNLKATLALHLAFYNFCRVQKTLRCKPAMESGIADHVWSIQELLEVAHDNDNNPNTPFSNSNR